VRNEGREVSVSGPKPRALLAVLLLHPNEVVPADRLIDELWGEDSPERAAPSPARLDLA
jgi:DNA-binding SARP family transcriptional activator